MPDSQIQKDKVEEIVNETTYSQWFKEKMRAKLTSWIDQLYNKQIPKSEKDKVCEQVQHCIYGLVASISDDKKKTYETLAKELVSELEMVDDELMCF